MQGTYMLVGQTYTERDAFSKDKGKCKLKSNQNVTLLSKREINLVSSSALCNQLLFPILVTLGRQYNSDAGGCNMKRDWIHY